MHYIFCHLEVGKSKLQKARILIANKGAKSLIGRDWLNAFNYKFVSPNKNEGNQTIHVIKSKTGQPSEIGQPSEMNKTEKLNDKDNQNEKIKLQEQNEELFTRQGQIRGHKVKIEFNPDAKLTQQKGRRVPIQLQEAVQEEIERLLSEGHIEKVTEVTDKEFIQPVVITVKRDKSVIIALDARALINELNKVKYQMPSLEHLVDMVAEKLDNPAKGQALYTSLDLRYAYGQVPLDKETARHCNFQILDGRATGIYRFITGCYGLTVIATEFQKAMDKELSSLANTFVSLHDILIVTKGNREDHCPECQNVGK